MMRVLLFSANYGSYDWWREPCTQTVRSVWRCYDEIVNPLPFTPRMAGRFWKYHPPSDFDVAIWLDANITVTGPTMVADLLDILGDRDLALFRHCCRNNIQDEAKAMEGMDKYRDVMPLVHRYAETHQAKGLYELHAIVWRNSATARRLQERVWIETLGWSTTSPGGTINDQMLMPQALADLNVEPAIIPGTVWGPQPWWPDHGASHVGVSALTP